MSKKTVATLWVIAPIVLLTMIVAAQAAKPKFEGDTITETFSQGQPCATVVIPLNLPDGVDPLDVSKTVFAALKPVKGMNTATLNLGSSSVEVGFCESSANEQLIRQTLLPTGLIAAAQAPPADSAQ